MGGHALILSGNPAAWRMNKSRLIVKNKFNLIIA
jgi:hypothetical protein